MKERNRKKLRGLRHSSKYQWCKFPRKDTKYTETASEIKANIKLKYWQKNYRRHHKFLNWGYLTRAMNMFVGKSYQEAKEWFDRKNSITNETIDREDFFWFSGYCLDDDDIIRRKERKSNTKPVVLYEGKPRKKYRLRKEIINYNPEILNILNLCLPKSTIINILEGDITQKEFDSIKFAFETKNYKANKRLSDIIAEYNRREYKHTRYYSRFYYRDYGITNLFEVIDLTERVIAEPHSKEFVKYHRERQKERRKDDRSRKKLRKIRYQEIYDKAISDAKKKEEEEKVRIDNP